MSVIKVPNILIPNKSVDLEKWSVVACDQFTSEREYWSETETIVNDSPSTLNMILPEVYLEDEDVKERVTKINETMEYYLSSDILKELPKGFILIERTLHSKEVRKGLLVSIDLESYSYNEGDYSLIRPTEKTVTSRIPPRLEIRKDAKVEVPHIMILIDDPKRTVIEPLFHEDLETVYDTDLMQKGGHIKGFFVPEGDFTNQVITAIDNLLDRKSFNRKYRLTKDYPLLNMAVGDGNHSLATAKANWELVKETLSDEEKENHPARFCLCELVNIHDESLLIEPIHRVAFNVDPDDLFDEAKKYFESKGSTLEVYIDVSGNLLSKSGKNQVIPVCFSNHTASMMIKNPPYGFTLASLQSFLDDYMTTHPEMKLDYIHGDSVAVKLSQKEGNIAFLLPPLEKNDLFKGVIVDGVLPRKTFSMGEANEKRYYMEAKKIR